MNDPICPLCHNPFLPNSSSQRYCERCRSSGEITRARDRRRHPESINIGGYARWVRVLDCPVDEQTGERMFTPGVSKFPMDQFLTGLREGVWPVGMEVEVSYMSAKGEDGGRKQTRRRYKVGRDVGRLARKLERDWRELSGE